MTDELVSASAGLTFVGGLWLGAVPSRYGMIELVLAGTPEAPDEQHLAAIQAFMPHASETIERLRRRFALPFLWHPVRLAPNNQNRVGVQFQRRIFSRREILFADE
jgi:hypothetical protein